MVSGYKDFGSKIGKQRYGRFRLLSTADRVWSSIALSPIVANIIKWWGKNEDKTELKIARRSNQWSVKCIFNLIFVTPH